MEKLKNSVNCEVINKRVQGDKILFTVNMYDLSGRFLYQFPGTYCMKTGKCECHYRPMIDGVPGPQDFEGQRGVCENYPNGNCDVLCKEILDLAEPDKEEKPKE